MESRRADRWVRHQALCPGASSLSADADDPVAVDRSFSHRHFVGGVNDDYPVAVLPRTQVVDPNPPRTPTRQRLRSPVGPSSTGRCWAAPCVIARSVRGSTVDDLVFVGHDRATGRPLRSFRSFRSGRSFRSSGSLGSGLALDVPGEGRLVRGALHTRSDRHELSAPDTGRYGLDVSDGEGDRSTGHRRCHADAHDPCR